MEIITKSAKETKKFGEKIAADLVTNHQSPSAKRQALLITSHASTLALTGDLGSGKTTFVKGLAKGLGITQRILSPTFILMRQYDLGVKDFFHIDLYRLDNGIEKEMKNLGIDELWSGSGNVIAIEWAEKAKDFIPKNATWIVFKNIGKGKRKIIIK